MKKSLLLSGAVLAAVVGFCSFSAMGQSTSITGALRAARARQATLSLDVPAARAILEGGDPSDVDVAMERARVAIYAQECDEAVSILNRPELSATGEGALLNNIARGCARATAATILIHDETHGVAIRLQDDDDRALAPYIAEVTSRARALFAKELGVTLPSPLPIVIVRDQFTLAAMTGLPEEAARTTGTVAVAKWGRVTMISPRAVPGGFAWLDTLVHELTHLALAQATADKAPLWLQEGVAKSEEGRWRAPEPSDDVTTADAIAAIALEKGVGHSITKLGQSIAMLPTAEEARIAYSEVTSFIRYWKREAGDEALPQLLLRIKSSVGSDAAIGKDIEAVSGANFDAWDSRWKTYLATVPRALAPELVPGASHPHMADLSRRMRLGKLLDGREHHQAAAIEYAKALALAPTEPVIACGLALAELAQGNTAEASRLTAPDAELRGRQGRFISLRERLHPSADPDDAYQRAIALDPLNPMVACEERAAPSLPSDPARAALCEAARRVPVSKL